MAPFRSWGACRSKTAPSQPEKIIRRKAADQSGEQGSTINGLPLSATLPEDKTEVFYPAPKITWHANADEHLDALALVAMPDGLKQSLANKASVFAASIAKTQATTEHKTSIACSLDPPLQIVIAVSSVQGVHPPGDYHELGCYFVTAFYSTESEEIARQRQTLPSPATMSSQMPSMEDCSLDKRITIPFRNSQQYLKVALYRQEPSSNQDTLMGEVTLPLADPSAETLNSWPVMLDFEQNGMLLLSIGFVSAAVGDNDDGCDSFAASDVTSFVPSPSDLRPSASVGACADVDGACLTDVSAALPCDGVADVSDFVPFPAYSTMSVTKCSESVPGAISHVATPTTGCSLSEHSQLHTGAPSGVTSADASVFIQQFRQGDGGSSSVPTDDQLLDFRNREQTKHIRAAPVCFGGCFRFLRILV